MSDYTHEEEIQLEQALQDWTSGYLNHDVSLHEYRVWLLERSWFVSPKNKRLIGLYGSIQSRLMRFASGTWTEAELRESIAFVVDTIDGAKPTGNDPMKLEPFDSGITSWKARPD